jgi:transposase
MGNRLRRFSVFVIGIDPHKGSHSAAVLDEHERLIGEVRVRAGRRQREELVAFASRFEPRCWAIEGATGTGALLAQQLVAVGETVFDVPPTLSARARLLDTARIDKTDARDARSAAVVALRHSKLRTVALEDHRPCCDCLRNATTKRTRQRQHVERRS